MRHDLGVELSDHDAKKCLMCAGDSPVHKAVSEQEIVQHETDKLKNKFSTFFKSKVRYVHLGLGEEHVLDQVLPRKEKIQMAFWKTQDLTSGLY